MSVINGTAILLSVNGERVAALTANDESYNSAMLDVTVKESMGDSEFMPSLRSADLNCSGLFFEQFKNFCKKSENFDNSIWTKDTGITITINNDSAPAPFNRKTADEINWGVGTFIEQLIANGSFSPGDIVDFSIWLKDSGNVQLELGDDGGSTVSSAIALTSSFVRYDVSHTMTTANNIFIKVENLTATKTKVFGAQVEKGNVPTSYFPSGTKLQDLINLELAGTKVPCVVSSFVSGEMVVTEKIVK